MTDYNGFLSNCRLRAKPWPHHGVIALSFDDHNFAGWEKALPLFEKYGARTTFFVSGPISAKEIAFARKALLAGHEIGLHGLRHRNADRYAAERGLAAYWTDEIAPQLDACLRAGIRPRSFGYPNGVRTPETDELFRTNGFMRVRAMKRAGERAETLSVVSHDIAPDAKGISMKTAWLERLLAEADAAGVIVRGTR